jgi:hypothetical protein
MKKFVGALAGALALVLLAGCATPAAPDPALVSIDQSRLAAPNTSMTIAGLGPCTDSPDRTLKLASSQPVTVLVHGCFSSAGLFRGLAQVLAFHGQQTACFTYNDRDSLKVSASQLSTAIAQLGQQMDNKQISIIGHSQGALIARKALVAGPTNSIAADAQLRLVTVSGPFAGIAAANTCGNRALRVVSLGIVNAICQAITGDKWSEITPTSAFILDPGHLHARVKEHLKVVTDERGSCRRINNGNCAESDAIFSLAEQRNPVVDSDPLARIVEVKAGHVEIVGDKRVAPVKLITILQQNQVILPTAPDRMEKLGQLLSRLYGVAQEPN